MKKPQFKINPTLLGFLKKEFSQALRDPRMRMLLFVAPIIQMVLFGVALSTEVRDIKFARLPHPNDTLLEHVYERALASGWFEEVHPSSSDPFEMIQSGQVDAVLVPPPEGLTESFQRGQGRVQLLVNATNVIRAQGIEQYVQASLNEALARDYPLLVQPPPISFDVRIIANPEMKTAVFMVPGVLCMIILLITTNLTSMSLVKEKESGTFEMLVSAPVKAWEVILGKTLPYVVLGMSNIPLILGVAVFFLGVPMRGSVWLLGLTSLIFICTTVSVGTLISTVAQNQQQAMMGGFFFIFVSNLLSGTMVAVENMPPVMRYLAYCDPLTHFVTLCRNIMLKGGTDPKFLAIHLGALTLMGVFATTLSFRRFKTTLG